MPPHFGAIISSQTPIFCHGHRCTGPRYGSCPYQPAGIRHIPIYARKNMRICWMKKIFIMEILCIYAKRRFFARYFEMYCHFIISGENESEEWEIGEEEREAIEREEENIQQVRSQFRIDQTCQMKGKPSLLEKRKKTNWSPFSMCLSRGKTTAQWRHTYTKY